MKTVLIKNNDRIARIILVAAAFIYFAFGFGFLIYPDIITIMDGFVLPDRPAANHIRAVYGGMEIGLGMVLIYFSLVKDGVRIGLIVLAFSIGATAVSRLYGMIFDQGGDLSNVLSFAAEFAFALIALILVVFSEPRRSPST